MMGSGTTDDGVAAELARLDERIGENDAQRTPNAQWRAADAVYQKAELIEQRDGDEAALGLYTEVIRRLDGRSDPGPRALSICAANAVAVIHHTHGRDTDSRATAEALVHEHFDDAPQEAAEAVANATLLLARLQHQAGDSDEALALLERLIERYGQASVAGRRRTAAVANTEAAWILRQAGRLDEAIGRYDAAIEALGDPSEPELRRELAEALTMKAYSLSERHLPADCHAVCKALVQRFGADRDPEIAENVAWAQTVLAEHASQPRRRRLGRRRLRASDLAQDWFALGCRLHGRVGRAADAERAYREAIAVGDVDAWLNLGIVLAGTPGREGDEQAALRIALGSDNPETASWAALKLGIILDRLQGDLDGARACFEIAAERGTGVIARNATANLAFLAAYRGDRAAARDACSNTPSPLEQPATST